VKPVLSSISLPDFTYENHAMQQGYRWIAGVDEVGRGPLAGPVVVGAVILDADHLPQNVQDSKRLSRQRRQQLFGEILSAARAVSFASVNAVAIDQSDIRQATLQAMRRALASLAPAPDFALIDGRDLPPFLPCPALPLVKGDARCLSIASAAILAKVLRDQMMQQAADQFPLYGFEQHAGYGTKAHIQALRQHGPVKNLHRFSFSPLQRKQ